jgi:hypothetical protein
MRVKNTAKVQGELSMDAAGFRGGAGTSGSWGEDQSASAGNGAVGTGAGFNVGGGGFGSAGQAGASSTGGQTYGAPFVGRLFLGAGGGGGGGAVGGTGGGAIFLSASTLTLAADAGAAQGRIHADAASGCTASGGGAGGTVWMAAPNVTLGTPGGIVSVSALGGNQVSCATAGKGGNGRVRIDYFNSADANGCARATNNTTTCANGVAAPMQAQSLDAYTVPGGSLAIRQATLVTALGDTAGAVFSAAASNNDPPDFGVVQAAPPGGCPANTACFNSNGTSPAQGTRFRWKAQLSPLAGQPQFLHALQWSLKAQ